MNPQKERVKSVLISFALLAFLACGVTGVFCPKISSAAEAPHPQPASHHSSSQNTECPDQFKNSVEGSKQFNIALLHVVKLVHLGTWPDLFQSRILQSFFKARGLTPSSYPLLFLRFSALSSLTA